MNKTIIITGGSTGLGYSTAKLLSKSYKVYILSRSEDKLKKAAEEIGCEYKVCDVSDWDQVETSINEILNESEYIEALINCAGIWIEGQLGENSAKEISQAIDINTKGTIYPTKAVLQKMLEQNEGFIINVSSSAGLQGRAGHTTYAASKFAVRGFTDSLREDMKETNIRVVGFYPGGMKTEFFAKQGSGKDVSAYMETDEVAGVIQNILQQKGTVLTDHVQLNRRIRQK